MDKDLIINNESIKSKIYYIREKYVILDRDIAKLYGVEPKYLKRQVNRNIERFPNNFMLELTKSEFDALRCQFVTSKKGRGGIRYLPYAFTEYGISMLSSILKNKKAVEISIKIIEAFVKIKKYLTHNNLILTKFQQIDQKLIEHDNNFDKIFDLMQNNIPKQGIFFDGQIFDSYKFVCDLIKSAKKYIILIDNYIDETVLEIFTKTKVNVKIYTANNLSLDVDKYKKQYNNVELINFKKSHNRFLIIDEQVYHIGASLKDTIKNFLENFFGAFFYFVKKDLGKKWFAFSKLNKDGLKILDKI
jgi:sugar-specific transcriptional regulator TrmB